MFKELNIPEELVGSFRRIQRSLPEYLKNDAEFLERILAYLKLGGDKFARQRIEMMQKQFDQDFLLTKRRFSEEPSEEEEGVEEAEESEEEDTDLD